LKKEKALKYDFNDLLFEDRNRRYGAYYLRKKQKRFVWTGLFITCSVLLLGLSMPYIIDFFKKPSFNFDEPLVNMNHPMNPPKGVMTQVFLPPPPPRKEKNTVPVVVKQKIEEPAQKEDPKNDQANISTDPNNKDSTQKTPGTGVLNGDDKTIYFSCDVLPALKTNEYSSINDYLRKKCEVPQNAKIFKNFGKVIITATVNKDGTLSDIHPNNHANQDLTNEALRVVREMPRLSPAIRNGKPVRLYIQFPIVFSGSLAQTHK
jgi:periplasmic protein TonB